MKKLIIVAILLPFIATSCITIMINKNLVRGEGEAITQLLNYEGDIEGLAISSCVDVVLDDAIEPGTAQVTTSPNIMEYVELKVDNGTLSIGLMSDHSYHVDTLEVRISPCSLSSFAVSGGASLESTELVTLAGDVSLVVSGGADIELCGNFGELNIAASGGADVELCGSCDVLNIVVSGGCDMSLEELVAEVANASASGGADLLLYATKEYHIQASGGADVRYFMSEASVDVSSSGGADISVVKRLW